jgi:hypothetical protein
MNLLEKDSTTLFLFGDCCLKANCSLPLNNNLLINPQSKNSINIFSYSWLFDEFIKKNPGS